MVKINAMATAPRDGTWVMLRSKASGAIYRMHWDAEGWSWADADGRACNVMTGTRQQIGNWASRDGVLQGNEVDGWFVSAAKVVRLGQAGRSRP